MNFSRPLHRLEGISHHLQKSSRTSLWVSWEHLWNRCNLKTTLTSSVTPLRTATLSLGSKDPERCLTRPASLDPWSSPVGQVMSPSPCHTRGSWKTEKERASLKSHKGHRGEIHPREPVGSEKVLSARYHPQPLLLAQCLWR